MGHESIIFEISSMPDFIGPELWPPNSLDLNPDNYKIWGLIQDRVYQTAIHDVDKLKQLSDRRLGRHEAEHDQQGY